MANLKELAESVAKELVFVEAMQSRALISVPLLYPSGASAVVNVSQHGDRFFVSDLGYGLQEAEMYGGSNVFSRCAKGLASHYGVTFDNQSFFVAEASKQELPTAVTIVANCSVEAAQTAALKVAERRYSDDAEIVYSTLVEIFPQGSVQKDAHVMGSSMHRWPVAALVTNEGRQTIFEPVNKHHNSIVNAAAKFHDIARLDQPPTRVAMVQSIIEMKNYVNLLSQAANVIEFNSAKNEIIRLAA